MMMKMMDCEPIDCGSSIDPEEGEDLPPGAGACSGPACWSCTGCGTLCTSPPGPA